MSKKFGSSGQIICQGNDFLPSQVIQNLCSFSYNNTYSSFGGGANTINADVLQQLKFASNMQNQSNGGSYALQVMNQLTHHILQDQVNKQQPTNMQTPRYSTKIMT